MKTAWSRKPSARCRYSRIAASANLSSYDFLLMNRKMRLAVQVIVAFVLVFFFLEMFELAMQKRMNGKLVQVEADDASTYYVKDLENKKEAAALLARTKKKLFRVVEAIRTIPNDEKPPNLRSGLDRLVRKHCHEIRINELDATEHKTVAMNRGKGREIHVCLRKCPDCLSLAPEDRLFIVALHELAHSATSSYDPNVGGLTLHGDEFKRYEYFVVELAKKMNLLNADAVVGTNYCGIVIPSVKKP